MNEKMTAFLLVCQEETTGRLGSGCNKAFDYYYKDDNIALIWKTNSGWHGSFYESDDGYHVGTKQCFDMEKKIDVLEWVVEKFHEKYYEENSHTRNVCIFSGA